MAGIDRAFMKVYGGPVNDRPLPRAAEECPPHAAAAAKVPDSFLPAFGVEQFFWPESCDQVAAHMSDELESLIEDHFSRRDDRSPVVAWTSMAKGHGATTIMLALARMITLRRRAAVLVDGDFERGDLAERLGLAPQIGWEDVLGGKCALAESTIVSDADGLALLPLCGPCHLAIGQSAAIAIGSVVRTLRGRYEAVLIRAGAVLPAETTLPLFQAAQPDGAILVADSRQAGAGEMLRARRAMGSAGVPVIGMIENFAHGVGQATSEVEPAIRRAA